MVQGLEQTQVYEKTFNVTNHQGNTIQTHNEIPHDTCQNGYYQTDKSQLLICKKSRDIKEPEQVFSKLIINQNQD